MKFSIKVSSENVTKSAENRAFDDIYWRNHELKTSFFVQWISFIFKWGLSDSKAASVLL